MTLVTGITFVTCLTLPILYTRGPTFISYYVKFGVYYLSLTTFATLFTPYFLIRGRTADEPVAVLKIMRWIGKWILGLRWKFTNSDAELTLNLRNQIKGGAVIGKKKCFEFSYFYHEA